LLRSALFPLEDSLVVTTNGEKTIALEKDTSAERGVSSEGSGSGSLSDGVSEDSHVVPVITSGDEVASSVSSDLVDVRSIGTSGEDTINVPRELDGLGGPHDRLGVGSTGGILSDATVFTHVPEKEFVGLASRSEPLGLNTPVNGLDGRGVLGTSSAESPGFGAVDADLVVVRSNSKELAVRGNGHNLNPFLGILKFLSGSISFVNMDDTIVSSNDALSSRAHSDSTGALRLGFVTGSGSTLTLLLLGGARGNTVRGGADALLHVPDLNLVIISGSDNAILILVSETPDLTVVVRLHDDFLGFGLHVDVLNASVTSSDEQVTIDVIDSTDHRSEGKGLLGSHGRDVPDHDVSVFASSEEHVVDASDGRDVASLVCFNNLVEGVILPDKDASVLGTGVEGTLSIGGADAVRHGGNVSMVSSVDSSVFNLRGGEVPEFDVLHSGGADDVRARGSGETDIVDSVGISLHHVLLLTSSGVENVDVVVVRHVHGGEHGAIRRDGQALDTLGTLG